MADMDSRRSAFENKFKHDEETRFKIVARRNKLLGQWAAQLMGLIGESAESYAKEVVAADFEEAGDEDVFRKVAGDLKTKGLDVSEHRIRKHMEDLLEEARVQITGA